MIQSNTYSEVFEILSYMDKKEVMKIPDNILINIAERRNPEYKSRIVKEDLFNNDNISNQTIEILAWLDINYWMDKDKRANLKTKANVKLLKENTNATIMFNNNYKIHNYNGEECNTYIVEKKNNLNV